MSKLITVETLRRRHACTAQVEKFAELFPNGVEPTLELCVKHAADFNWSWAACNLLTASAQAQYEAARASAQAQYEAARASAQAQYEAACASAWAQYDAARASVWAQYDAACASAWAQYDARAAAFYKVWAQT